jgi:hypothetical protein
VAADLVEGDPHTGSGIGRRIIADLDGGIPKVGMTQDVYMTRGKVHSRVADLLDAAMSGA